MRFFNMPTEDKLNILKNLSRKDRIGARLVDKDFRNHVEHPALWRDVGASDYDDFVKRIQALPHKFQSLILSYNHYTLPMAEDIVRLLALPELQRAKELFPRLKAAAIPNRNLYNNGFMWELMADNGVIAICEGLITPAQAAAMPEVSHLRELTTECGIIALRDGLITPEEAARFIPGSSLMGLLTNDGISALRNGLVTLEEARATPSPFRLASEIGDRLSLPDDPFRTLMKLM